LVKDLVMKGIGIHHSGMIPLLKEMVEILYK
jgi:superfamily II RNA helicase